MNMKRRQPDRPYMRDFAFFRQKFSEKHRDTKNLLQKFGAMQDRIVNEAQQRHSYSDLEEAKGAQQ